MLSENDRLRQECRACRKVDSKTYMADGNGALERGQQGADGHQKMIVQLLLVPDVVAQVLCSPGRCHLALCQHSACCCLQIATTPVRTHVIMRSTLMQTLKTAPEALALHRHPRGEGDT